MCRLRQLRKSGSHPATNHQPAIRSMIQTDPYLTFAKISTRPPPSTTSTSSTCTGPAVTEYDNADLYLYTPNPTVPPLETLWTITNPENGQTTTSIECNYDVFNKYFQPSIFNCACGRGPHQTLNSLCEIVVGPIFTSGCGTSGYTV